MKTRQIYLAQNLTNSTIGRAIATRLQWHTVVNTYTHANVRADYIERMQRGEPGLTAEDIFQKDASEIEQCDGFILDLSKNGALYVGALVELGYAAAMGKPIVVYAPEGVNQDIYERVMVRGTATVVHSIQEGAQVMAAKLSGRA
jgi:nucleoside 2-deoxyribosyltransferase